MIMHFVFKIGPLPGVRGPNGAYFVYPGREGVESFFASSDEEAFEQVTSIYSARDLECEPQLGGTASKFSVPEGQITPDRAGIMGLLTFEIALPDHFRDIKSQSLVYQYGISCSAFWRAGPWRVDYAADALQITFQGAVDTSVEATVMGQNGEQFGLAMFPRPGSLRNVGRLIQDRSIGAMASLDMLGVTFEAGPDFALNGMLRCYDLERFPVPMKVVNGERVHLSDTDLLILASALRALSTISSKGATGTACVNVGDLSIEAAVSPYNFA